MKVQNDSWTVQRGGRGNSVTPKAFANSSPGLSLRQPWGQNINNHWTL